jgi:hypothetical protein
MPDPGMPDPPAEYQIDFPSNLQSGSFERGEEVNVYQWGNWLVVQGAWETVGLYRFLHKGGVPEGYDASLVNGSGETLLKLTMDHFCSFASGCDADPELFKLIAHVDGERLVLQNFEAGPAGLWFGEVGDWKISNDAFGFTTGMYDESSETWGCDYPVFTHVITAVQNLQ